MVTSIQNDLLTAPVATTVATHRPQPKPAQLPNARADLPRQASVPKRWSSGWRVRRRPPRPSCATSSRSTRRSPQPAPRVRWQRALLPSSAHCSCRRSVPPLRARAKAGERWRQSTKRSCSSARWLSVSGLVLVARTAWPHPPHLVSKGGRPASLSVQAARAAPRGGATESGIVGQYDGGRGWGRPGGGGGRGRSQAADAPRILAASD